MIKCIQLVNGHDIIGDVKLSSTNAEVYELKEAAAIHMVPGQQGTQFSIGMIPFMPYADGPIEIHRDKIVLEFDPSPEMRNNYSKLYGSGIEIANVMPKF